MSKELVNELYTKAFSINRATRSGAYKEGVKVALQRIFQEHGVAPVFYLAGSSDFDAFVSGRLEGQMIASEHMATCAAWGGVK